MIKCFTKDKIFFNNHVPVTEIAVKLPLQVFQHVALLQRDETSINSVEAIEKF